MSRRYRLADYRRQANKEPFPLELDDERVLMIPAPSTNTVLDVQATEDVREQLRMLTGDAYDDLMEAIGEEQGGVLKALMKDLTDHFGLGESRASRT